MLLSQRYYFVAKKITKRKYMPKNYVKGIIIKISKYFT